MTVARDEAWEPRFEALFPAYLLPSAMHGAISRAAAEGLVRRVLGPGASFAGFRASIFLAGCRDEVAAFALRVLPDLCRTLRGRTEIVPDARRGRLVGRLDVPRTLGARLRGEPEVLVSRVRARRFDHPAEVVVRAVASRLRSLLASLRRGWGKAVPSWASSAREWERALQHALDRTTLRQVPEASFAALDPRALDGQRHPAFALAATLLCALRESLDSNDAPTIARWVSCGALWPLEPWQRFELVVALTLAKCVEERLAHDAPGQWRVRHAVVDPRREDIVAFDCDDGRRIRMFYNQSPLASGSRSAALAHYFGSATASRPDVVVVGEQPGVEPRAVVIEVKLSDDASYLASGFDEALVYAMEYAPHLVSPAGSVLVTRSALAGRPRPGDVVVALGWPDWQNPSVVLEAVLATVGGGACTR